MKALFRLPSAAAVHDNPSADELQQMTAQMPNARWTKFGNLNLETRVVSRSTASTFVITDDPDPGIPRTISAEDAAEWIDRQDAYIAEREMIVIDGYLGAQPDLRMPVRLFMEAANANIAGMQQQLLFPVEDPETFEPELVVIYTPNLEAPGMPDDRLIIVDLEQGVTRVFNSDYFGESKKGFLRMWNRLVYERGGLPLHAGCKIIPTERGDRVGLIVGLSGTGKTTTTFTRQNGSLPVQDDFVAWLPTGACPSPSTAASRRRSTSIPRTNPRSTPRSRSRTRTSRTCPRPATRSTSTTPRTRRTGARPSRSR